MALGDVNYSFLAAGCTNTNNPTAVNLFGNVSALSRVNANEVVLLILSASGGDVKVSLDPANMATNDTALRLSNASSAFDVPPMTVGNASQISFARDGGGGSNNTPTVFWYAMTRNPLKTYTFTDAYSAKVNSLFGGAIVGYWPLWEPSGTVSTDIGTRNHPGAYTGVTLGGPSIGDARSSAQFDGVTSFDNLYTAGLNTDFSNNEATLMLWAKISAGTWSDATTRAMATVRADANNTLEIVKSSTTGKVSCNYIAAGSTQTVLIDTGSSPDWFHVAITVSKSGDKVMAFLNGTQSGTTQTGLGVWAGALATTLVNIGCRNNSVPDQVFKGFEAHTILLNRAATTAEIATVATVP